MCSNNCLICHGSSSTIRHRCRTRCAGRSPMQAAPRHATISTVTAIAVITAARRSRRSNGPCRSRGGFADAGRPCGTAWHCQPLGPAGRAPLARRSPLARQTTSRRWPASRRRWPAGLPGSACRRTGTGRPQAASAGRTFD